MAVPTTWNIVKCRIFHEFCVGDSSPVWIINQTEYNKRKSVYKIKAEGGSDSGTLSKVMQNQGINSNANHQCESKQQGSTSKPKWPNYPTKKKYNNKNYCWYHGSDTRDLHTSKTYTRKMLRGGSRLCNYNQWGYHKTIRHMYGRNDEIETGEMIRNILH